MSNIKGKVKAICLSEKRGTEKHPVPSAMFVKDHGILGDAHAGTWHRQVSLLSYEKIEAFNERGAGVSFGAFGENLVIEGIDPRELPVGTVLSIGGVRLRTTQLGKECHTHCAIYQRMGECIMPVQGVFAEVLAGGTVIEGDDVSFQLPDPARPLTAAVITLSDKGSRGERKDESGPIAAEMLKEAGYEVIEILLLPDEQELLKKELIRLSDMRAADLIITSGGTGFSRRDTTPEAVAAVADRNAPGIAEYIRMKSMEITPRAMLSRGVSMIRRSTLIVTLPGSPKAVRESLGFILPSLDHGLRILRGSEGECAR